VRVILYQSDKQACQLNKLPGSLINFHMEMEIIFQSCGLDLTILLSWPVRSRKAAVDPYLIRITMPH